MLCPPAFSYSITPYGAPYAGFGAPVAPAAPVTVVTSDGHRGHESQLNTLSDIAVGNLRESAASGRFAGVTNQIESIGNRMDANAAANRDMQLVREFTTVQKGQGDLENRLLTAIKDESIRTRDLFTEQRIRDLEGRLSNVQEARRDDRLMEVLVAISKKVGT
jgi:hypothetical protein